MLTFSLMYFKLLHADNEIASCIVTFEVQFIQLLPKPTMQLLVLWTSTTADGTYFASFLLVLIQAVQTEHSFTLLALLRTQQHIQAYRTYKMFRDLFLE